MTASAVLRERARKLNGMPGYRLTVRLDREFRDTLLRLCKQYDMSASALIRYALAEMEENQL